MLTELGRSQVEVQRCSLNSAGPRLRSSSAHCARKLAKSWQGGSDAEMVEEKLEKLEEREEEKEVEDEEEAAAEEENNCDKI